MGCFHLLAIINNAVNEYSRTDFCVDMFSILVGIFLGVELLGQMATLCLIFSGVVRLFFQVATAFSIPTSVLRGF